MTTAADIIAALLPRKPAPVLERRTGLPHGWGLWLRALPDRLGRITHERTQALVALLAQRAPRPETRKPALSRWQALRALFYQQWDPPPREERGLRWFAASVSALLHLLFAFLLILFALISLPPPPGAQEESRVQVEFIGRGTPDQAGGGAPAAAAATAAPSPAAAAASSRAATTTASRSTPAPASQKSQPRSAPPSPPAPAEQRLQVTETERPTGDFVLPPVTPRRVEVPLPQVRMPEAQVPEREVAAVETPALTTPRPVREIAAPVLTQPQQQVREREVPAPVELPRVQTPRIETPQIAEPALREPERQVREREVPAPVELPQVRNTPIAAAPVDAPDVREPEVQLQQVEVPAAAANPAPATATPSASAEGSAAAASRDASQPQSPAAQGGDTPAANASGPALANRPGAQATPQRADDWGASDRNVPGQAQPGSGQQPGLFNADGSVRVPGEEGVGRTTTQPGPPGSRARQAYDADRANKWLERVEYAYEPTMFDKYWVPRESLLEEWVRKGIKSVEVPIPGTSKRVRCVISLLQVGGGCGLFDSNLNDQPAGARPPPEIPVKRNPPPGG